MDTDNVTLPRIPVSTYRLNFNNGFTFSDATKILPYMDELGISDVYASPCFAARKGTVVGYDVVDPTRLNLEIGTEKDYNRFTNELQKRKMGQILDIVPNHMYIEHEDNGWWMDILENGPASPYAAFFDIDWHPVKRELENKVLIPILGDQYGTVLERRELKLIFEKGTFSLTYYDHRFPILPETYMYVLRHGIEKLESLLPVDDASLVELLSILTALSCLPSYTEREQVKLTERSREKEIIKKRLYKLYRENRIMRDLVDENLRTFNGNEKEPHSLDLLDDLLSRQIWRLSYWRVATEEINYRRFFDINSLAAIKMENPVVFQKTHELLLKLIGEGKITGLRVDHPDGLYNPSEYMKRLQRESFLRVRLSDAEREKRKKPGVTDETDLESQLLKDYAEMIVLDPQFKPFYIVGEKILIKGEKLPEDWPVFSSIGYQFLNPVNGIFVDTANSKIFERLYERFTVLKMSYQDLVYEKKRLIMLVSLSGEINTLAHYLNRLSEKNRHTRDFTLNSLRGAIMETIACFPVYRTYITQEGVSERDRRYVEQAIAKAKRKNPTLSQSVFDYLKRVLLIDCPDDFQESDKMEWVEFTMRLQQITGPVMAKGVEDTVFYIYNRLISLNEVGGNPEAFGTSLEAFHGQNLERARLRPHSFLTTSTHDTKRSEDVRARINVLSEIPGEWQRCLGRWARLNVKKKPIIDGQQVPDRNEEYLLYQTLVGSWPGPGHRMDDVKYEDFKRRIREYMVKAIREAKINSSWINPDTPYEEALTNFIDSILQRSERDPFIEDFTLFQNKISYFGMFNSLSQTLLKITSPGVPDFYQGCELWDFSLVDPDNRRPVDFTARQEMLNRLKKGMKRAGGMFTDFAGRLFASWADGAIKLYVIYSALTYRKEHYPLFRHGAYASLAPEGVLKELVCAFARVGDDNVAITAVPRFLTRILRSVDEKPFGNELWQDTTIPIPDEIQPKAYYNIFTGETITAVERDGAMHLRLGEVFANFPVALLSSSPFTSQG